MNWYKWAQQNLKSIYEIGHNSFDAAWGDKALEEGLKEYIWAVDENNELQVIELTKDNMADTHGLHWPQRDRLVKGRAEVREGQPAKVSIVPVYNAYTQSYAKFPEWIYRALERRFGSDTQFFVKGLDKIAQVGEYAPKETDYTTYGHEGYYGLDPSEKEAAYECIWAMDEDYNIVVNCSETEDLGHHQGYDLQGSDFNPDSREIASGRFVEFLDFDKTPIVTVVVEKDYYNPLSIKRIQKILERKWPNAIIYDYTPKFWRLAQSVFENKNHSKDYFDIGHHSFNWQEKSSCDEFVWIWSGTRLFTKKKKIILITHMMIFGMK